MRRIEPEASRWQLPDPLLAPQGADLIAAGSAIEPALMLAGYRQGLFAMPLADTLVGWFSPDPRGVLPLERLHVSRSLRRALRRYRVSIDRAFEDVVEGCADPQREGHWIAPDFVDCYRELHRMGWAHSIEVWDTNDELAGGLFGVEVAGFFSGESMFHRERDASKVAVVALVERLVKAGGNRLLDVQWLTPHLQSLGVTAIKRREYVARLRRVADLSPAFESATDGLED